MARNDLIIDLVKAGVQGDSSRFRTAAEAIAAEERAKRHGGIAERISKVLDTPPNGYGNRQSGLRVRDGSGGIQRCDANRAMSTLYLSDQTRAACTELVEEQRRAGLLRAHGLEPRHRVLLIGPPGNGKTSLAESIAFELGLPLLTVRYDAVITSYLGETAQRLRRLFDYVQTEPCVLFFDEFDAIGKERGDLHETGEIKRVVTALLLQMDDLPSYCVLVGATNHPELLDRATWRRFELRLELAAPAPSQMIAYLTDRLRELGEPAGYTAKRLYKALEPQNFSEAEAFFLDVRRRVVLSEGLLSLRSILNDRVKAWTARRPRSSSEPANELTSDSTPSATPSSPA